MINWDDIRKEFPVTANSAYLNTAAAGPLARQTRAAACAYYDQIMQDGDIHWDEWLAKREEVRKKVASFLNAEPEEIGFTTNTSSGMNIIIDALENHGEVISCDLEFPTSTLPWMNRHIPVHLVKSVDGGLRTEDIASSMDVRTGIICLSHVQYSTGFRLDTNEIAEIKGQHVLVLNCAQSAGAFEIDVKRMGIDALCATGHKWMLSGYGSGFVYISKDLLQHTKPHAIGWLSVRDPYSDRNDEILLRHDVAARAELGCPHFSGIFAMGASLEMMLSLGSSNIQQRALELNHRLTESLIEAGWEVLSPIANESSRSAETLVAVPDPASLVSRLADQNIVVTQKPQGIRVATHFFNNDDDISRLIEALGTNN